MKKLLVIGLIFGIAHAQTLYEEHFTNGQPDLQWEGFFSGSDTLVGYADPSTPEGDGYAGKLYTEEVFGLAYSGSEVLTDYSISAWVYTVVTPSGSGPYNGIVARLNPVTSGFYLFAADFDSDRRLRLSYHSAPNFMPQVLHVWYDSDIPGGLPTESGWHHMSLNIFGDSIWCYFDNYLLPGGPFFHDSSAFGWFGVYAVDFSGTAETRVDQIIVSSEPYSVSESRIPQMRNEVVVYPSVFTKYVRVANIPESIKEITVFDKTGRLIWKSPVPQSHSVMWSGINEFGREISDGIYFIKIGPRINKVIKLK